MRSDYIYSDEDLMRIWNSWGIFSGPGVSVQEAANYIRWLEFQDWIPIEQKYKILLNFNSYNLGDLNQFLASFVGRLSNPETNRIEWTLLCLDLKGAFNEECPVDFDQKELNEQERIITKALASEGLLDVFRSEISAECIAEMWLQYESKSSKTTAYYNFGGLLKTFSQLQRYQIAKVLYQIFWKILSRSNSDNNPNLALAEARFLQNWASVLIDGGYPKDAIRNCNKALDEYYLGRFKMRLDLYGDRVQLLAIWGNSLRKDKRYFKACLKYQEAYKIFLDEESNLKWDRTLDFTLFRLFNDWLMCGFIMADHSWFLNTSKLVKFNSAKAFIDRFGSSFVAANSGLTKERVSECSKLMASTLELRDWKTPDHSDSELSVLYARFHIQLLASLLRAGQYREVPEILCALQGRKLARYIQDELDLSDSVTDSDSYYVSVYKSVRIQRAKLRQINVGIDALSKRYIQTFNQSTDPKIQLKAETDRKTIRIQQIALEKQYQESLNAYIYDRNQLLNKKAYKHLAAPYEVITVKTIQQHLNADQALVFLVDLEWDRFFPGLDMGIDAPQVCFYWLIYPDGKINVVAQNSTFLASLIDQISSKEVISDRLGRLAIRKAPITENQNATKFAGWGKFHQTLKEYLWQPLSSHLKPKTKELVLVSHGRFHQLPLTMGMELSVEVRHYPAIQLFIQSKSFSEVSNEITESAAISYTGTDLLLAQQESHLMTQYLWRYPHSQQYDLTKLMEEPAPKKRRVSKLYLSCHGDVDPKRPEYTHLLTGPGQRITFHEILKMPLQPDSVFIGACVAGQTFDDRDGDPLGPVTAFMMQGAQCVIACLTPVPDFWMPLLAYLTEYSALHFLMPIDEALGCAKSRLKDWQQHVDYQSAVEPYWEWLRDCLVPWLDTRWERCNIDSQGLDEQIERICGDFLQLSDSSRIEPIDQVSINALLNAIGANSDQLRQVSGRLESLSAQLDGTNLPDRAVFYEPILKIFKACLLSPPPEVIALLTHSVRAFGKGVAPNDIRFTSAY